MYAVLWPLYRLWNSDFFSGRIYHVDDTPSGSVDGVLDYSKAIQVGDFIIASKC